MAPNDLQVVRNTNRQDHLLFKYVTAAPRIAREARRGSIPRGHSDHTTVSYVRKHPPLRTADASGDATKTIQQMTYYMRALAKAQTSGARISAISNIYAQLNIYCKQVKFWDDSEIKDFKKQVADKIGEITNINGRIETYKAEFAKPTTSRERLLALIPQIYDEFSVYISVKWPDTAASSKEIRAAIKSLTDELGNKLTANGKWESGAFEKYFTVLMQASTNLLNKYPEPAEPN